MGFSKPFIPIVLTSVTILSLIACSSSDGGGSPGQADLDSSGNSYSKIFRAHNWCYVEEDPESQQKTMNMVKVKDSTRLETFEYTLENSKIDVLLSEDQLTYQFQPVNKIMFYGSNNWESFLVIEQHKRVNGYSSLIVRDESGEQNELFACDDKAEAKMDSDYDGHRGSSIFKDVPLGPFDGQWYTPCKSDGRDRSKFTEVSMGGSAKIVEKRFGNSICLGNSDNTDIIGGVFTQSRVADPNASSTTVEFVKTDKVSNKKKQFGDDLPLFLEKETGYRYQAQGNAKNLSLTPLMQFERLDGEVVFEKPTKDLEKLELNREEAQAKERNFSDIPSGSPLNKIFDKRTCETGKIKGYVAKFVNPNQDTGCHSCLLSEKIAVITAGKKAVHVIHFQRKIKPMRIWDEANEEWKWVSELGRKYGSNIDWSYQDGQIWLSSYGIAQSGLKFYSPYWQTSENLELIDIYDESVRKIIGCD